MFVSACEYVYVRTNNRYYLNGSKSHKNETAEMLPFRTHLIHADSVGIRR